LGERAINKALIDKLLTFNSRQQW